jgi:hypothetical protein
MAMQAMVKGEKSHRLGFVCDDLKTSARLEK